MFFISLLHSRYRIIRSTDAGIDRSRSLRENKNA